LSAKQGYSPSFTSSNPTHAALSENPEKIMPVVRVTWFDGKEAKAKQAVAAEITESIVKHTGTDPNYIYVVFEDVKPSDWAGAGKLFG
jgi:4-oxalocrotonate tautomerase